MALRKTLSLPEKPAGGGTGKPVPGWLTGIIERLFFMIVVAVNVAAAPSAMIGWLALKLATNWNHPDWKDTPDARTHAFCALLAGLISMMFAMAGGLLIAPRQN